MNVDMKNLGYIISCDSDVLFIEVLLVRIVDVFNSLCIMIGYGDGSMILVFVD